ncbi:MAG: DUF502 domain-containing protein [Bacteroidales bacterium]|jgi:uncharacterized membrane protein
MKKVIRYFLQGLLFIAPAAITIYIVYVVFTFLDGAIQDFFEAYMPFRIPGLGLLALLVIITILGFIGQSIIFRPFRYLLDRLLRNAPIVNVVYSAIKDLLSAFVGKEKKFNKPVLVKVNLISDLEKIGFLTTEDLNELGIKDKVSVYFPHSYNFSGEMFIVPKEHIRPLSIPPAEAMKFIVSGGVTKV